jgi:hypothetical protein
MAKKLRGGKRHTFKNLHPGGGGEPYPVEVIEVYMKIKGKAYGSSYSIRRHGVRKANQLADDWLEGHRALAEEIEAEGKS